MPGIANDKDQHIVTSVSHIPSVDILRPLHLNVCLLKKHWIELNRKLKPMSDIGVLIRTRNTKAKYHKEERCVQYHTETCFSALWLIMMISTTISLKRQYEVFTILMSTTQQRPRFRLLNGQGISEITRLSSQSHHHFAGSTFINRLLSCNYTS